MLLDVCRCTNGDVYVGSSRGLALLVWVGGGLLKPVLYFFSNEPSLGRNSPILHLPLDVRGTGRDRLHKQEVAEDT